MFVALGSARPGVCRPHHVLSSLNRSSDRRLRVSARDASCAAVTRAWPRQTRRRIVSSREVRWRHTTGLRPSHAGAPAAVIRHRNPPGRSEQVRPRVVCHLPVCRCRTWGGGAPGAARARAWTSTPEPHASARAYRSSRVVRSRSNPRPIPGWLGSVDPNRGMSRRPCAAYVRPTWPSRCTPCPRPQRPHSTGWKQRSSRSGAHRPVESLVAQIDRW